MHCYCCRCCCCFSQQNALTASWAHIAAVVHHAAAYNACCTPHTPDLCATTALSQHTSARKAAAAAAQCELLIAIRLKALVRACGCTCLFEICTRRAGLAFTHLQPAG